MCANFELTGITWKAVEMLEQIILAVKHRPNVLNKSGFLPILADVLFRSNKRTEYLLRLIQDITFGLSIRSFDGFLENLIKYVIHIITDEQFDVS